MIIEFSIIIISNNLFKSYSQELQTANCKHKIYILFYITLFLEDSNIMGGKSSKGKIEGIDEEVWQKVGQFKNAEIMRNRKTNQQGQQRSFVVDPRHDFSKQLQIYTFRRDYEGPLVKVLAAQKLDGKKTSMCGKEQVARVITEKIPYRWSEIYPVSYPESVYALQESLRGYQQLYEKVGPFQVTPEMIGVNEEGAVKVWLNENFAQNHPPFEKPVLQTTTVSPQILDGNSSQSNMVRNVFDIIQRKCERGKFPLQMQYLMQNNSNTFFDARTSLSSYINNSNLYLPNCIKMNQAARNISSNINSSNIVNNTGINRLTYGSGASIPMTNTNRYTIESNRQYFPAQSPRVSTVVVRQPNIRVLSPPMSRTSYSVSKTPYISSGRPILNTIQSPRPIARFTYQNNPIQTSQVTQRYY